MTTLVNALLSGELEENLNRACLRVLLQSFNSSSPSAADDAMFIHLVRFCGIRAALVDTFAPVGDRPQS